MSKQASLEADPSMSTPGAAGDSEWNTLLAAARDGDDDALGVVYNRFYRYLTTIANHGIGADLRTKMGASDVVQQSMLEVNRDLSKFVGESEEEFRRWIAALLRKNLIDMARRYKSSARRDVSRELCIDSDDNRDIASNEPNASHIARRKETDEELARAVESLPDRQRQVIVMRHRENFRYEEIAARMSITEQAARQLYSRAVRALKQQLVPTNDLQG